MADKATKPVPDETRRKPGRGRRSREATRQKLIDAALRVMARKGVDGTAIADITEEADVGFGSFYNHFKTKGELAEVVFHVHAEGISAITKTIARQEKDQAVAVSFIHKVFLTKAVADPVWGWFLIHTANWLPELWSVFAEQGTDDIRRGIAEGRFTVSSEETAMRIILASLVATMRLMLDGQAKAGLEAETIECLLRMLGVPGDEARKLSRRKLPAYVAELLRQKTSEPGAASAD
ncbi:TetR/AcrR family transcriptional regulator [Rhizorhabdus histidinilytica]|uniref:TetR/AcrR family transcriptional regulator n=1 Tax=Rhizorhabdus histidinilytica TaxID=439228 RepID=UPI00321FF745